MNLIDILDIYALQNDSDNMLLFFDDYVLDERIDKDVMNTTIISELGATKPITTNPDLFKVLFDNFFKKYANNITKLLDTMYYEYNPLHNKDLEETEHRESVGDIDNTDTYTTNTEQNETAETEVLNTGTNITEQQVSAYDSSTYQPKQKDTNSPNLRTDTDATSRTTNDVEHSGETTSDISSTVDLTRNITGKDGQDSYQSLITQERKLAEFNIFNWIIKRMREELFLLVY